jgi:hypothetical protein
MSIQTLAKKSRALYYKNHSVPKDGFSLNGKLRLPGITENLGRSQTSTPFRGTAPMGHGGGARYRVSGWRARARACNENQYPIYIVSQCNGTPQTLVKRSAMSARLYMSTLYCCGNSQKHPPPFSASAVTHANGALAATCDAALYRAACLFELPGRPSYNASCRPHESQ